jgi:type II secretory pathway pseudopilin PulG
MRSLPPPNQRGFSLIEALIALIVTAFGALALTSMQMMLSHHADLAKQRTEAMRLAQARMEQLRAFVGITSGSIRWNDLPIAAETVDGDTNASFKLAPVLGGTTSDPLRSASVTVRWLDRTGNDASTDVDGFSYNQQVAISSVISNSDPHDVGLVGNPRPWNAMLRPPRDRHIDIPVRAIELGAGRSATQFDADYVLVYIDSTGEVIQVCNPGVMQANAAQINAAITSGACATMSSQVVSGYIGRSSPAIAWPTGVSHAGLMRNAPAAAQGIRCQISDATDPNGGGAITAGYGYKYYLCVIPLSAPSTWAGTLRLGGLSTTGDVIACRYEYTAAALGVNERNVQPYVDVRSSIDAQNYLITGSAGGVCPTSMTVAGVSTGVLHQDCRASSAASHATACPPASP